MTSSISSVRTELRSGPIYFFDQPTRRAKGTRCNILQFSVASRGPPQGVQEKDVRQGEGGEPVREDPAGQTCEEGEPDTSPASPSSPDRDLLDVYKQAAPHILNQLAELLSQHKWPERRCIPHGIVNILNFSWTELTAGAELRNSPKVANGQRGSKWPLKLDQTPCQVPAGAVEQTGERPSCGVGNVASPVEGKAAVGSNPRVKKRKQIARGAQHSTTVSLSTLSSGCSGSGWIIQTKLPSDDEPHRIRLCQWVVERLQAARSPGKLQSAEQDLDTPLLLRHYGDAKTDPRDRSRKVQPAALVDGILQIPDLKQLNPGLKKLHYRIDDGSSFIYYPSGCVAVCQSHSGLPCGGFYTNVFSDGKSPIILATITAFGRGAVTYPLSSAIKAVWDQDGGFMCDKCGNKTKQWSWQTNRTPREKIVVKVSDLISVRLFSGVSATLSFRCDGESVQLPLASLSQTNKAKDIVPVRSQEVLQRVGESEGQEEQRALCRGGLPERELKKLQQRVRRILENWLDYYRVAIGIKCPDSERMPDAPPRTRGRRKVQSAALPSLNPPERADAEPPQPGQDADGPQQLHRHPSAPAEASADSVKLPRTPNNRAKKEQRVTVVGPLKIYGNNQLESVSLPSSPGLPASVPNQGPAVASFTPSVHLTVCPALLRAALRGETPRKRSRCCCSAVQMPSLTDLEYDAFVTGQLPHSPQMLVVFVRRPRPQYDAHTGQSRDALEELYKRRNRHRTMPCTQCQMDSFRLVRYETSTGESSCGAQNFLLQQRHNVAPGMILMYIRGKLLFVGYTATCSARDLQKQICKTRRDYRLGLSLPPDYRVSNTVNFPESNDVHSSPSLRRRDDITVRS